MKTISKTTLFLSALLSTSSAWADVNSDKIQYVKKMYGEVIEHYRLTEDNFNNPNCKATNHSPLKKFNGDAINKYATDRLKASRTH